MNPIIKLISIFVPVRDGAFDRPLLWEHPIRYAIPNAFVLGPAVAVHLVYTGAISFVGLVVAFIFSPMLGAGLVAFIFGLAGFTYRG